MIFKSGGRKFVLALLVWFTSSMIFILTNKLGGTEYASIMLGTLALYNGTNAYQKKILGEQ
jgi:hypothetical protein